MDKIHPHLPPKTVSIRLHNFFKQSKFFILSLVIGFFSGAAAAMIILASFAPYDFSDLAIFSRVENLRAATQRERAALREKTVPKEIVSKIKNATVYVYHAGAQASRFDVFEKSSDGQPMEGRVFEKSAAVGHGFFITTDGWVAFPIKVFERAGREKAVYFGRGNILKVAKFAEDPFSQYAFIKFEGENFPILDTKKKLGWMNGALFFLGNSGLVLGGEDLTVSWKNLGAQKNGTQEKGFDVIYRWPVFEKNAVENARAETEDIMSGALVFDVDGNIAGLIGQRTKIGDLQILPVSLAEPIFENVFLSKKIQRDLKKWKYVFIQDLNWVESEARLNRLHGGALLTSAEKPLQKGDVILSIGGVDVADKMDLAAMAASLVSSGPVKLKILRSGAEEELVVYF